MTFELLLTVDHLAIAVRCYADTSFALKPPRKRGLLPKSALIFDCETTTDERQALRFGVYHWKAERQPTDVGLFYDAEIITEGELLCIEGYAARHELNVLTVHEFVDKILFTKAFDQGAKIIGFNLPFDLSRIAIKSSSARGSFKGGFSFAMSQDKRRPNIQVKNINSLRSLIQFAAPFKQRTPRGMRNRGIKVPVDRG